MLSQRLETFDDAEQMSRDEISNNVVCANQQSLRPACAYAQSGQSLCLFHEYSMSVKLQAEHDLGVSKLNGKLQRLV